MSPQFLGACFSFAGLCLDIIGVIVLAVDATESTAAQHAHLPARSGEPIETVRAKVRHAWRKLGLGLSLVVLGFALQLVSAGINMATAP